MKNCTILIEQSEGNKVKSSVYRTDDYRIATALCNILNNVGNMEIEHDETIISYH